MATGTAGRFWRTAQLAQDARNRRSLRIRQTRDGPLPRALL